MRVKRREVFSILFSQLFILIYGAASLYLYYHQSQWVDGAVYESDLPAHIRMAMEEGGVYSLTSLLYRVLYPLPGGIWYIILLLTLCTVGAVYATAALLRELDPVPDRGTGFYEIAGLMLNLVMPCYVKGFSDGRYIGMQSPSIWHNSTYIVMKFTATLCILFYFRILKRITEEMKGAQWLSFTLLLLITTAVKPSFLVVLAPAMLILLIVDLIRGVPFRRLFLFGCGVIPSLGVILVQNALLFGGDSGNGYAVLPGQAMMQHTGYPVVVTALSLLFPLVVLFLHGKDLAKNRWYLMVWLMTLVGFLEYFLLAETGTRGSDGNFLWGYSIAIFLLFTGSLIKWLLDCRDWKMGVAVLLQKAGIVAAGIALIWHVYCGLYFFIHLVQGTSYWMWG
ncbi:MAG: hypothetical protein K5682_08510 [Lachnospiraceae bacterium]|nr:hypothetical protein [Lachnospiraceae bacterium]